MQRAVDLAGQWGNLLDTNAQAPFFLCALAEIGVIKVKWNALKTHLCRGWGGAASAEWAGACPFYATLILRNICVPL